jgi:hypothetical protein
VTLLSDGITEPEGQLGAHLRPGERLLWSGRPDPAVTLTHADWFVIPFSIFWTGFSIAWEASAVAEASRGTAPLLALWGIPFVAIGLFMLYGRFVFKRRRKRRTAYGLTDRRALVAVGDRALSDSPVRAVPTTVRRTRDGAHVSVSFGSGGAGATARMYANTGMEAFARGAGADVAFYDVADVDGLLGALQRAAAAGG